MFVIAVVLRDLYAYLNAGPRRTLVSVIIARSYVLMSLCELVIPVFSHLL
jgi:hypothetical protein